MPEITEQLRQITEGMSAPAQQGGGFREGATNFLRNLTASTPALQRQQARQQMDATGQEMQMREMQQQGINALVEMFGPAAGAPGHLSNLQNAMTNQQRTQQAAAAQQQQQQQLQQEQRRNATTNLLRGMQSVLGPAAQSPDATPQRIGEIFDTFTDMFKQVDPSIDDEQLQAMRQMVVDNPEVLEGVLTGLTEPQSMGGGTTSITTTDGRRLLVGPDRSVSEVIDPRTNQPVQEAQVDQRGRSLDQADDRLSIQRQSADIREQAENRARMAFIDDAEADASQARARLQNIDTVASQVGVDVQTLMDLVEQSSIMQERETEAGNIAAGTAATVAQFLPRSTVDAARRQINTIRANIAVDQLLDIKREGSGLGQVPQSQLTLLGDLLGDLDVNTRPQILGQNLRRIQTLYNDIAESAQMEAQELAQRTEQRRAALGVERGQPASADADITVDFDEDGNLIIQGMD